MKRFIPLIFGTGLGATLGGLLLVIAGYAADVAQTGSGAAGSVTNWQAALNDQMKRCWVVLSGPRVPSEQDAVVTLHIELNLDGSVKKIEEVPSDQSQVPPSPTHQLALSRALGAVRNCAPFKLPSDKYDDWGMMDFVFDPRIVPRAR